MTGLAPGTTYHFQLIYTLHNWTKSSNTATVTTTAPPKSCGGTKTVSLADGKTYTFTLLGGGGGQGGNTGGAGGAGSTVTGSLTTPSTGTFSVVYEVGCSGQGGGLTFGGAGGSGYAAGGTGGTAHTTNGGGGGGGGGATYLALKDSTTTVIAVAGGGGGGGGSKTPSSHSGLPALANLAIGAITAAITGQNGKIPHDSSIGGMGTGAGGGGAGTQAPNGGTPYKGTPAATTGKTAGKGGTGGYNFKHSNATVTGVAVTVTVVATGSNPGEPGSFTLQDSDPPSPSVSPEMALSALTVTMISPTAGPIAGGTQVTVTGTGFSPAAKVSFGEDAATNVAVKSPTELVATSPAHSAGPVDVVVSDVTGTSATSSADVFTYVTSASSQSSSTAPTVTGVTPSSGSVTGETTITITGTGFTKTATVSFGTTPATSVTFTSSTTLSVVTPAHTAGTVTVTVTASGGSATAQFTYAGSPSTPSSPSGTTTGGTS